MSSNIVAPVIQNVPSVPVNNGLSTANNVDDIIKYCCPKFFQAMFKPFLVKIYQASLKISHLTDTIDNLLSHVPNDTYPPQIQDTDTMRESALNVVVTHHQHNTSILEKSEIPDFMNTYFAFMKENALAMCQKACTLARQHVNKQIMVKHKQFTLNKNSDTVMTDVNMLDIRGTIQTEIRKALLSNGSKNKKVKPRKGAKSSTKPLPKTKNKGKGQSQGNGKWNWKKKPVKK
ncbi:hypothetical protein OnM2_002044 [Erysiphe neolycopersici]|uniref:Uncharacterized protein n=1 Tax=Erysiphe neolycopersici TaxID=212602 RepID=A0A420I7U0_9PEZI|nr:hypothetical protein OnM2_002044 [Erysiphe neolycopersici]